MKRSVLLALSAALFLLLSAQAPQTKKSDNTPSGHSPDPKGAPQQKIQNDEDKARQGVDRVLEVLQTQEALLRRLTEQKEEPPLPEASLIETQAIGVLGLLLLTTILATGTVLLGLRQSKALLALEKQIGQLQERLDALKPSRDHPPAGSEPAQDQTAGSGEASSEHRSATPQSPVAAPPRKDDLGPAASAPRVSMPPPQLHQEVYSLLAKLRQEAPTLASKFADPALCERFQGEFDAPLGARLERLRTLSDQGEEQLRERWLVPDLVTTLDALGRFYSEAVDEERRRGRTNGLAQELRAWLYDSFGSVCRREGWFAIDPVDPYVTTFDPKIHHAVAGRDIGGAEGRIIAIKSIGRREPKSGAVTHKAEVIVGR